MITNLLYAIKSNTDSKLFALAFSVLFEMSQILNCGLDQRTLTILAGLIENGVNPEALAAVVKELKRETEALKVCVRLVFRLSYPFKIDLLSFLFRRPLGNNEVDRDEADNRKKTKGPLSQFIIKENRLNY